MIFSWTANQSLFWLLIHGLLGWILCNLLPHRLSFFSMYRILRVAIWLLPLYLGYQLTYQIGVFTGLQDTYNTGEMVTATVEDFRIKQIAAQTNGYIVLDFTTADGTHVNQLLSLPVQMAAPPDGFRDLDCNVTSRKTNTNIVITATYAIHRNMVVVNMAVLTLSLFMVSAYSCVGNPTGEPKKIARPETPVFCAGRSTGTQQPDDCSGIISIL